MIANSVSKMVNSLTITERSDGRLMTRITVNGKRKTFYGSSKAEVKSKAREYLTKLENGYREPERITVSDYIEYWMKTYKLNKIEPTSYSRMYRTYISHIKPTIGDKMIGEITTSVVQNLIDEYAIPTNSDKKSLARSGLKKILHLLSPAFAMAVQEKIITENPCDNVVVPKESCVLKAKKEQWALDDTQIEQFKESALCRYKSTGEYCSRDAIVLLLMLNTGTRVGEMQALKWSDVDEDKKTIRITRTVQNNIRDWNPKGEKKIQKRIKASPKTTSGNRVIPINDTISSYLEILQGYDERHGIQSEYVACTSVGTMTDTRSLQRSLDRVSRRMNLPPEHKLTLHTLRHTFGSVLLRKGVNIAVISKLMGHANINVTLQNYIHVLQEEQVKAMQNVEIC